MEIKSDILLNSPPEQVWLALNDPSVLARCTPGCRLFEPIGESEYRVVMEMDIAAVKGRYEGKVTLYDKVPNTSYRMRFTGDGLTGFVQAEGLVSLQPVGEKTRLSYSIDAQIGGKIAGIGQRVIGGITKLVLKRFFDALEREANSLQGESLKGEAR